jgi:hypothetical protein
MHALQALPIALLLLELLSRRVAVLREVRVRTGLVWIAAAGWSAGVALVTWQALRGQSIVQPDLLTAGVTAAIVLIAVLAATAVVGSELQRSARRG